MAVVIRSNSFGERLKEEISQIKTTMEEHLNIQNDINQKLLAHISITKHGRLLRMFSTLTNLAEKCEELDDELEDIANFFSNINAECECGKKIKLKYPHNDKDHNRDKPPASINKWQEMWIATIPNHMSLQDDFNFSYSDEQKILVGHPYFGLERCGPVECLNFQGLWKYTLADFEEDRWHQIVTKQVGHMNKTGMMWSRYLLLPEEMSGLTIVVKLNQILGSDEDRFQLSIFAPENKLIEKNYSVPLPSVYLCVQLEMKLEHQQYYISEVRQFEIRALSMNAVPDEFTIPFSNARTDTLPEIVLKFSKP